MISLIIGIFLIFVVMSAVFALVGVVFSLLFKFLGVLIVVGIVAWLVDFLMGGRLFRKVQSYFRRYGNNSHQHRDWYVVNKKNRRRFDDHDEWSDF